MTPEERKTAKEGDSKAYDKASNVEALEEFLELDFIAAIEEEMQCSGFCKTSLFYWEKGIYDGYPTETCGYSTLKWFRKAAGPLRTEMTVVAFTCLWLFILHFCMYAKKPEEGQKEFGTGEQNMQEMGYNMPDGESPDKNNR